MLVVARTSTCLVVRYLMSHGELRDSETEGFISNMHRLRQLYKHLPPSLIISLDRDRQKFHMLSSLHCSKCVILSSQTNMHR
jgi:hypothetical protein